MLKKLLNALMCLSAMAAYAIYMCWLWARGFGEKDEF